MSWGHEGYEENEISIKGRSIKVQKDGRPVTCMGGNKVKGEEEDEELQGEDPTLCLVSSSKI